MTDSAKDDPRAPEIPHFEKAYNSAHKAYGLASALLIAWELIGVELDAAPVENFKVTLKSPQAAPYVLIALIIYFGFRLTIEWCQTDLRRRKLRASRINLAVAHGIAIGALALYAYQTLAEVQIANIITGQIVVSFSIGLTLGQSVYAVMFKRGRRERPALSLFTILAPIGAAWLAVWLFQPELPNINLRLSLICVAIGSLCGVGGMLLLHSLEAKMDKTNEGNDSGTERREHASSVKGID